MDTRMTEQRRADRQQGPVDTEVLPILARAERLQKRWRLTGPKPKSDPVVGPDPFCRLAGPQPLRHVRLLSDQLARVDNATEPRLTGATRTPAPRAGNGEGY